MSSPGEYPIPSGMVWGPLAPESYLQIPEAREQT